MSEKKADWCGLKDDPTFVQCCCNCIYHRPVHFHCCTEPKPTAEQERSGRQYSPLPPIGISPFDIVTESRKCVCGVRKGWACIGTPPHDRVYDNWPEHSCGCEEYTTAEMIQDDDKRTNKALDLLFRSEHPNAPGFKTHEFEPAKKTTP